MTTRPNTRTDLQRFLEELTGLPEERVCFQPPEGTKLLYPCVVYRLSNVDQLHADNLNYRNIHGYEITLMSKNPDSKHATTFENLAGCKPLRFYAAGNLNYWIYRFWTNL